MAKLSVLPVTEASLRTIHLPMVWVEIWMKYGPMALETHGVRGGIFRVLVLDHAYLLAKLVTITIIHQTKIFTLVEEEPIMVGLLAKGIMIAIPRILSMTQIKFMMPRYLPMNTPVVRLRSWAVWFIMDHSFQRPFLMHTFMVIIRVRSCAI